MIVVYRYKLVRGALDFGGVVNRATARSRYGGSFSRSLTSRVVIDTSNSQEAKIIDHFLLPTLTILHINNHHQQHPLVYSPFFVGGKR